MFQYEDMKLDEILMSPDISLEDPEALYAIAQCYRLGKGTEIDLSAYQNYLQAAAEAGFQIPEKENQQLKHKESEKAEKVSGSLRQGGIPEMSLEELVNWANQGDMAACFEIYQRCNNEEEEREAISYLKKAVELAETEARDMDYGICREIFLCMGQYYMNGKEKNIEKSIEFYGKAAELGSSEACRVLSDCYRKGIGVKKDLEKALGYLSKTVGEYIDNERYDLALECLQSGHKLKGYAILEELQQKFGEKFEQTGTSVEEAVKTAWEVPKRDEVICFLCDIYGVPSKMDGIMPPTAEQAWQLAQWQKKDEEKNEWIEWAAQRGYPQAKDYLENKKREAQTKMENNYVKKMKEIKQRIEKLKELIEREERIKKQEIKSDRISNRVIEWFFLLCVMGAFLVELYFIKL